MGQMRFVVSPPDRITPQALEQVYMTGIDRVAWQMDTRMEAGQLVVRRGVSESGNLHVPWPVEGRGLLSLSTGSLMERPQPYLLPVELARGTIGRLANQLSEWQTAGMAVPQDVARGLVEATACFGQATVGQEDVQESAQLAERAISAALDTADLLVASYVGHTASLRRSAGERALPLLGGNLGPSLPGESTAREIFGCLDAAVVPICWRQVESGQEIRHWDLSDRQIEWCRTRGLKVCGGPLLQLDAQGLPDWLFLYEDDFDHLFSCVTEHVAAAVARYRGKVDLWQCAGRLTSTGIFSVSEEDKLRLAARTIELVGSLDPNAPAVISFDQPWGEYLAGREIDLPPLYLADALVRAGLNLSGLLLEVNLGYHPGGTLPRPPLEFSRLLDYWGLLGLPLYVSVTVPSAEDDDPLARRRVTLPPGDWTPQTQQDWAARHVPLILAKPLVQGVFWNQLYDSQPHDFPHGGLFDPLDKPKPVLDMLTAIRQTHLA